MKFETERLLMHEKRTGYVNLKTKEDWEKLG